MLSALKEIISPKVVINFVDDNTQKCLILKEDDEGSAIEKLYIRNIPTQAFAFSLDFKSSEDKCNCFTQLSSYLNYYNNSINKSCDLVIVAYLEGKWVVILLELKSNRKSAAKLQLDNSEFFIKYVMSLVKNFHPNSKDISLYYQKTVVMTIKEKKNNRSSVRRNMTIQKNKEDIYVVDIPLDKINSDGKIANIDIGKLINLNKLKPTKL